MTFILCCRFSLLLQTGYAARTRVAVAMAASSRCSSQHERSDADELAPALPGPAQATQPSVAFHRIACLLGAFGVTFLTTATFLLLPVDVEPAETSPRARPIEELAWSPRSLAQISCSAVMCGDYATTLNPTAECEGPAGSDDCFEKCCGDIACDHIPGFDCEGSLGSGYRTRQVSYWKAGQKSESCKGQSNCEDTCCQRLCADVVCAAPTPCQRPFPPHRCTPSTCQQQCCYGDDYCGNGITAWTEACEGCESLTAFCESVLGLDFETTPTKEWNHAVFEKVMSGTLEPGCEVTNTPTCEKELKFRVIAVFPFHKNGEGVSVNGLDIIAGGTQAVSGGDDKLVFIWRIADGHLLRNYSAHYSAVRTISTFNDATFFCAASSTEAIVWRSSGPQDSGILAMEFTTDDPPNIQTTSCIGINTWETAIVGQTDSFAQIWKWKGSKTMQVPEDPREAWKWQIDADAGYHRWGDSFKGHSSEWRTAFTTWRKNLFGLSHHPSAAVGTHHSHHPRHYRWDIRRHNRRHHRRLDSNTSDVLSRRLRPADRTAPWTNWFTNTRWGDVPVYYYQPDDWGPVTSLAAIPFDTLFAVGYDDGSIRVWKTYNGFLRSIIPQAHDGAVTAMVSAPAGNTLYSGGSDGYIRMWDVFSGKFQAEMYAAFAGPVRSLAVIPGGNNIYSGHAFGLLLLWIPGIQKLWCALDTEAGSVNAIAVNPAVVGQVLLALENGEARVYEMR